MPEISGIFNYMQYYYSNSNSTVLCTVGCIDKATGQFKAVSSMNFFSSGVNFPGILTMQKIVPILFGSGCVDFFNSHVAPLMKIPLGSPKTATAINIDWPKEIPNISDGEKNSEVPPSLNGAHVVIVAPDFSCCETILKSPK